MNLAHILFGLFALSAVTNLLQAEPQPVTFDRFEYSGQDAVGPKTGATEYHNPILAGFYPDPSICRVGDDYYLVNSTFAYFPGIPVFHSRDLVNWEQVGNVIDRPDQLRYDRLGVSAAIFAPTIRYHNGTFFVICTMVGANGNFIVTATNVAGPWSNPVELRFEGIDPSLLFDEDRRAWVVNNGTPEGAPLYGGHRAIWIQEFDAAARRMVGPRKVIVNGGVDLSKKPGWIEGPHLYKRDGWYYLCCAEGGTGPQHSEVVFRSRNVDGPYTPWDQNPILTQRDLPPNAPGAVTCTGHADLVVGPDNNWWAVFLGVRPYDGRFSPMGRETFLLPVKWTGDGWPIILPKGERVPLAVRSPNNVALQPSPAVPLSGNFNWRDGFKEPALLPLWIMLRTPKETWWKLDPPVGQLMITPRAELLSGTGNPSYLARRVQHARFTASTSLEVPNEPGVSAGLAIFQNERHHYFLAVRRDGDGLAVYLERTEGRTREVVKSARVPHASRMKFRMAGNDAKCTFEYAADADAWQTLVADADATLLTTEVAGGFVGATVGMHARIDRGEKPATSPSAP
jgi:alpha-N-arabinofuranosidase